MDDFLILIFYSQGLHANSPLPTKSFISRAGTCKYQQETNKNQCFKHGMATATNRHHIAKCVKIKYKVAK